ncbi:MAG: N-6 DNA methylase [Dehalococcoidia bacterium]|nr:N-6 DNA methylase [Dehalococcoidia bacterium]
MVRHQQKLPMSGPAREALREKGQFWTPDWVAEAMVSYVVGGGADHVFDPAVGAGAFFSATKAISNEIGCKVRFSGTELDPNSLEKARLNGLLESDLAHVEITDFVLHPPTRPFKAIVANPPYIRHHRLSEHVKAELKKLGTAIIGKPLDGRAGLHIYFLLRALQLLAPDGRLAFIMPADTCEGVFAPALWSWVTKNYRLDAVITFTPEGSPFPQVDTNPIILMIRKSNPDQHFFWLKCHKGQAGQIKRLVTSGFERKPGDTILVCQRRLSDSLSTGLSREPSGIKSTDPVLGNFASVLRGIATGANDFFFLTDRQASDWGIPDEFLIPAIGRTRDVVGDEISPETIHTLESKGRPTLLFSPDSRPINGFPPAVREYLKRGETIGFHKRPLIATRDPWYKMEVRTAPPILFAYLGRRNTRFIRNRAGVVPLTGFLCVYPHNEDPLFIDRLWRVLQHPETVANLSLVGKSYGAGAIKVEPRALERLPFPADIVLRAGLQRAARGEQLRLTMERRAQWM